MAADKTDPVFTCECKYFQLARTEELNEDS